jgi:hypothetical protein
MISVLFTVTKCDWYSFVPHAKYVTVVALRKKAH